MSTLFTFEPNLWLHALTKIGGGYALASGRKLIFMVEQCDAEDLARVMSEIVGHADRQEAIKQVIESRQNGQVAA